MCEMLGNQYYITKKYSLAQNEFKKVLKKFPENNCAKKKLINCNIELGRIREAFNDFYKLFMNNIACLTKCDFEKNDCPCVEIIYDIESYENKLSEYEKKLSLGMLWLPLNMKESLEHFSRVQKHERDFDRVTQINNKINQIIYKSEESDGK